MAGRTTLDKWITDAINDTDKDKPISQLMLVHMQGGHQQLELHTFKFKGVSVTPKELAEMFRGKAETYAQDLDGRQMFQLLAYYGTGEPEARFPFVTTKLVDPTQSALMTEAPDDRGVTMQNMRHKEAAHTAMTGFLGQIFSRQQAMDNHGLRMIEQQANIINGLLAENFQNFGMIKELLFKVADDTHKYRMEEVKAQQSAETRKQLLKLAPALANSFTGREIFPQSTEDTALIEAVVENITEEQIGTLMGLGLPDVILGPLAARITKAMQKKRTEQEERSQLPKYAGSPEEDIGGGTQ